MLPNEITSTECVPVLEDVLIPDTYEALLKQERLGTLVIHRYKELSGRIAAYIRENNRIIAKPGSRTMIHSTIR